MEVFDPGDAYIREASDRAQATANTAHDRAKANQDQVEQLEVRVWKIEQALRLKGILL